MPKGQTQLPEAELVQHTFTLRQMSLPPSVKLTKRSMLRWFCLSFGLISEQESRSTIFDVLDAFFYFQFSKKQDPSSEQLMQYLKQKGNPISDKLLLYHLKRLSDLGLIERKKGHYFFCQDPHAEKRDISASFKHNISNSISITLADIESVLEKLAESYRK